MILNNKIQDYKTILNFSEEHHIAFTDGSCSPNNKSKESRGGYSTIFVSGNKVGKKIYGNLDLQNENASNIRAEGTAILRTLEFINDCDKPFKKLTIITDCEFWINMIKKFMPKWNIDKFNKKANPDITKKIWLTYNTLLKKGEVSLMHVNSHNKGGWKNFDKNTFEKFCYDKNDEADNLCSYARINLQIGEEIII